MTTTSIETKKQRLLEKIDWSRPELAKVRDDSDAASALIMSLSAQPRPRFRFEYTTKKAVLAFLETHYQAWREFDLAAADRYVEMTTTDAAEKYRSTTNIAILGMAWWKTGDAQYGETFQRFFVETETGGMFNWGNFLGSQPIAELAAYFLLLDCPKFETAGKIAFLDHLLTATEDAWDKKTTQWSQITLGPEGHNWYLHGMHCLPFTGLLFPEFLRSVEFVRSGWGILEEHLRGHYRADGGAREACIGYQTGSLYVLWDEFLMAQRNGWPVSPQFASQLMKATKFVLRLATPDGGSPAFGDGHATSGGLTQLAALAAALTGDGECKWYAEHFRYQNRNALKETPGILPYTAFWRVGLAGARMYEETRMRNPHQKSVLLRQTGYAALRNGDEVDAAYMAVAAANRGPLVTSHGHNDIFSLEVHLDGVRFLGDAGCAAYGNTPARNYDVSSQAHNTLTVEGQEQVALKGEWRWSQVVVPAVRRWISEPQYDFFHGVHEGFMRWPERQILHARKIVFLKQDPVAWLVFDWIEANVEENYNIWWHGLIPGKERGSGILLEDKSGKSLIITPPQEDGLTPQRVEDAGLTAYLEEKNRDAESYPAFVYHKHCGPHCFVWLIAPAENDQNLPQMRRLPATLDGVSQISNGLTAVEVNQGGTVTKVCLSHREYDGQMECEGISAWGNLAIVREDFKAVNTVADGESGQ